MGTLFWALIWPILVIIGIVWLVKKLSSSPKTEYYVEGNLPTTTDYSVSDYSVRLKVASEIRAQAAQYKTPAQKKVVEEMAQTVEYFALHAYSEGVTQTQEVPTVQPAYEYVQAQSMATATAAPAVEVEQVPYETPWKKLGLLDGATILLYLGAFFLLASIGLYVGFGAGTTIKALLVSLLTILFYGAGIALYKNSTRLKPAGMTFAAIGMATLPIAGAAIYYYALNQTSAPQVWLVISLLALAMYAHAMYVLRSSLVSYMVVFSSLSIVLSGISSVGLAPYYFIQGMGICGLLFALLAKLLSKNDTGLSDAYEQSSTFLVPFSVGMSVLFVSKVGWLQLALSLFVGALYYTYMAYITSGKKPVYALLAQMMVIPSVVSGVYGVTHNPSVVRTVLCLVVAVYIAVWAMWAKGKENTNPYRRQIKGILLGLPLVVTAVFLGSVHSLWIGVLALTIASAIVYATDRDALSGIEWVTGLLVLPPLVGLLALKSKMTLSQVGVIYLVILACAVFVRVLARTKMTRTDVALQRTVLAGSLAMGAVFQLGANNGTQLVVAVAEVLLMSAQSWFEDDTVSWFSMSGTVFLMWIFVFTDDLKLFTFVLGGFLVYNLIVAQLKRAGTIHSWFVSLSALALPAVYGLLAREQDWSSRDLWIAYGAVALVFMVLRALKRIVAGPPATFTYLTSFAVAIIYGYVVGAQQGLYTAFAVSALLLVSERLEGDLFGYLSPLIPMTLLFSGRATEKLSLLMVGLVTVVCAVTALIRRRGYEAFLAVIAMLFLPWLAGTVTYNWSSTTVCALYFGLTALLIAKRLFVKNMKISPAISSALQFGYSISLALAVVYGSLGSWKVTAASYFIAGLLLTAVSYIESSPPVIILSFVMGYASVLRYTTGLGLSLNYIVTTMIVLSQGTYWLLILSKLETVRASYARNFQLVVALLIPIIGIGYPLRSIFPLSLTLFGTMLAREVWSKGQGQRETALLVVHASLLWWLYTLGVREFQVYSQSTAALICVFAYWRRKHEDAPSLINQYIWTAVLTFSIPMVWQALSSGNATYSYLVLVEHVILILVSIAFKRATFAWWGIAVVVASVLYQLRKLRYAALAFLGVFIISLAVYFLLRYNKPEPVKK